MKQTASLHLKLPLKSAFFSVSFNGWKVKSLSALNFFISEYLEKILRWKEMKLAFAVKVQIENFCFFLT